MCRKNQALMHEIGYVSDPEIKLDCRIKEVLAIKNEDAPPELDLNCEVCKMSFSNFGSLFGHVKRTHPLADFVSHRQRRYKEQISLDSTVCVGRTVHRSLKRD